MGQWRSIHPRTCPQSLYEELVVSVPPEKPLLWTPGSSCRGDMPPLLWEGKMADICYPQDAEVQTGMTMTVGSFPSASLTGSSSTPIADRPRVTVPDC